MKINLKYKEIFTLSKFEAILLSHNIKITFKNIEDKMLSCTNVSTSKTCTLDFEGYDFNQIKDKDDYFLIGKDIDIENLLKKNKGKNRLKYNKMKNQSIKTVFENIFKLLKRKDDALVHPLLITNKTEQNMENNQVVSNEKTQDLSKFKFWFEENKVNDESITVAFYSGQFNPSLLRSLSSSSLSIIKKLNGLTVMHKDGGEQFVISLDSKYTLDSLVKEVKDGKSIFIWTSRADSKEQNEGKTIVYNDTKYEFFLKPADASININKAARTAEEFKNRLDRTNLELFMTIDVQSTIGSLLK